MKRLLCIRLPSWPLQRLVVAQPELSGRVVILYTRDSRRGPCVVACSRAAYRCGVRPHMTLAEATALYESATSMTKNVTPEDTTTEHHTSARAVTVSDYRPTSQAANASHEARTPCVIEHSPQADAEALTQLAQWCECFSPLVGFEHLGPLQRGSSAPQRRSDCVYLEVTNLAPYFGSEQKLAHLIAESFSRRGYVVRVAIADTLGAAWAFAHFAFQDATLVVPAMRRDTSTDTAVYEHTSLADISPSKKRLAPAPPSSFVVVPPGATVQALQSLPVQALRLPQDVQSLLEQLGIFQIAQLACLPRASLLSRFGEVLLQRWDQACGHVDELLIAHHPVPPFHTDWQLEHPTTNQAAIHSILRQLIDRLIAALLQRGEGVIQCVCQLTCTFSPAHPLSHLPLTLRIGLFHPTVNADHLQQLFHMQLERLSMPALVERMDLEASRTAPLERRQRELFSDSTRRTSRHLAQLVDRLSSRLGSSNVVEACLHSGAQPEFAYRYLPLTGGHPRRPRTAQQAARSSTRNSARARSRFISGASGKKVSAHKSVVPHSTIRRRLIRPVHLRSPPLPLAVVALAPDGAPVQLLFARQVYRIARCWGPERIETAWWRGHSVRRDYYRLETHSGHWLWVFRQLNDGNWFLHGMFG